MPAHHQKIEIKTPFQDAVEAQLWLRRRQLGRFLKTQQVRLALSAQLIFLKHLFKGDLLFSYLHVL